MWWPIRTFFILGALLVLQSIWSFFDGIRFIRLVRRGRYAPKGKFTPSAVVMIPCKGLEAEFDANLERFLNQDYPDYQAIFIVASANDPAYGRLKGRLESWSASSRIANPQTRLVVAGEPQGRGEKVNNLLRGVEQAGEAAQVLVFADIDAAPSPDWLRSLVAHLEDPQISVSTGYRWYLPGEGFASRLRAAWDTSIATMLGDHNHNFAWGGSMAMRAADFRKMRIAERFWANTVSDDLSLTRAVKEAGGKIAFEPRCLVASREESSVWAFFRWSTRQIILTRVYAANLWRLGFAASLFHCGTFMLGFAVLALPGVIATQRVEEMTILMAILLLGVSKGCVRTVVARELFGKEAAGHASCYWQLAPLISWIMLANFVASGLTRRIEWRGNMYELISPDRVRILERTKA